MTCNKNICSCSGDSKLYDPIPVLDKGCVQLVDYMGSDVDIAKAAKVCTKGKVSDYSDPTNLIRYLMRHRHTTPFEMVEFKFYIKCPMDVWRQWIRHRTASTNEVSTRYKELTDDMFPEVSSEYRLQSDSVKQGSKGVVTPGSEFHEDLQKFEGDAMFSATNAYTEMVWRGVAREQARKVLNLATYTEAFWKIDLHNLLHFLELRLDEKAQYEIRQYANAISDIVEKLMPITWQAFCDYKINSVAFSFEELKLLQKQLCKLIGGSEKYLDLDGGLCLDCCDTLSKGEKKEFLKKLNFVNNANILDGIIQRSKRNKKTYENTNEKTTD